MIGNLQRRIDRLAPRSEHLAGRLIVVEVHESRVSGAALLDAALTAAAVALTDQDLVVKLRRFAPTAATPPCAVLGVHPLTHATMRSPT